MEASGMCYNKLLLYAQNPDAPGDGAASDEMKGVF